jgi:hypothetical protein
MNLDEYPEGLDVIEGDDDIFGGSDG